MLEQTLTCSGERNGQVGVHMHTHGYRHTDMHPYEQAEFTNSQEYSRVTYNAYCMLHTSRWSADCNFGIIHAVNSSVLLSELPAQLTFKLN